MAMKAGQFVFDGIDQKRIEAVLNGTAPYHIGTHAHPYFELLYLLKGARKLVLGSKTYVAKAGDLMIFRPDVAHEESHASDLISFIVFRFHPEELASANLDFPVIEKLGPVIRVPGKERLFELFTRMMEEYEHEQDGSQLLLGAYLVEFVVLLRRAVGEALAHGALVAESGEARVSLAMERIQQNLSGDLDLGQLARDVFMSVSHFSHTFKKHVGESPKRYLIQERIKKAKELLTTTDMSAQDIAHTLGYETAYYFYRQFKREVGITAVEFRKRAK